MKSVYSDGLCRSRISQPVNFGRFLLCWSCIFFFLDSAMRHCSNGSAKFGQKNDYCSNVTRSSSGLTPFLIRRESCASYLIGRSRFVRSLNASRTGCFPAKPLVWLLRFRCICFRKIRVWHPPPEKRITPLPPCWELHPVLIGTLPGIRLPTPTLATRFYFRAKKRRPFPHRLPRLTRTPWCKCCAHRMIFILPGSFWTSPTSCRTSNLTLR